MTITAPGLRDRPLGNILVDAKVLSEPSLAQALERQQQSGEPLGSVLIGMGLVDERTIVAALGVQLDLPVVDLRRQPPDHEALALVPEDLARALPAAPVRRTAAGLEIAVTEPLDDAALARLEQRVGDRVVMRLTAPTDLWATIDRFYRSTPHRHGHATEPVDGTLGTLLARAVEAGASDVHLELGPAATRVRFRVDGVLTEHPDLSLGAGTAAVRQARRHAGGRHNHGEHRAFWTSIASGRVRVLVFSRLTAQGEHVRLGLTAAGPDAVRRLDELGMPAEMWTTLATLLDRPSGLIVVSGPRRSGRTTTAYAAALAMDPGRHSVLIAERSILHLLPSVSQVEVGDHPAAPVLLGAADDLGADRVVIDGLEGPAVVRTAVRLANGGIGVVMTMTAAQPGAVIATLLDAGIPRPSLAIALRAVVAQGHNGFELVTED